MAALINWRVLFAAPSRSLRLGAPAPAEGAHPGTYAATRPGLRRLTRPIDGRQGQKNWNISVPRDVSTTWCARAWISHPSFCCERN